MSMGPPSLQDITPLNRPLAGPKAYTPFLLAVKIHEYFAEFEVPPFTLKIAR